MKKKLHAIIWAVVIPFVIFFLPLKIHAETAPPNETIDFAENYSNLFIGIGNRPYDKSGRISGVDVAENGWFLIVSSGTDPKRYIDIYDDTYNFQRQLIYYSPGSLAAAFDSTGKNIILFPVRENVLIKVSAESGKYIDCMAYPAEKESVYWLDRLDMTNFAIAKNGKQYICENGRSMCIEDNAGNQVFQYEVDATTSHWLTLLIPVLVVFLFVKKRKH